MFFVVLKIFFVKTKRSGSEKGEVLQGKGGGGGMMMTDQDMDGCLPETQDMDDE